MCIISGPTTSVNSTKIFAIPSKDGKRQMVVYSNNVDSPAENLMCLPVLDPASVKFENVPKQLFAQCKDSFYNATLGDSFGMSMDSYSCRGVSQSMLAVQTHGSYEVVIIPSIEDTGRVPSHFATLTREVVAFMNSTYSKGTGFILCRLRKGSVDYEPFAYSHAIVGGALFLPTMHFHMEDSSLPPVYSKETSLFLESIGSTSARTGKRFQRHKAHRGLWDHVIYVAGCNTPKELQSKHLRPLPKNEVDWAGFSDPNFALGADTQMTLLEIDDTSSIPNQDFRFNITAPVSAVSGAVSAPVSAVWNWMFPPSINIA